MDEKSDNGSCELWVVSCELVEIPEIGNKTDNPSGGEDKEQRRVGAGIGVAHQPFGIGVEPVIPLGVTVDVESDAKNRMVGKNSHRLPPGIEAGEN